MVTRSRSRSRSRSKKESNDALSQLPDEILLVILSLLPLKSVIVTASLSRRWRWLWTHLLTIEISIDTDFADKRDEFFRAVDNLLPKFSSSVSLNRCGLDLGYCMVDDLFQDTNRNNSHIIRWFEWACRPEKHVQELRFYTRKTGGGYPDNFPNHPLFIFQASSLAVLHLRPWLFAHREVGDVVSNALFHLPNLKEISVELYAWDPRALEKLVSSSPSFQDLSFSVIFVIKDDYHTLNLSCPTLKRLEMSHKAQIAVLINAPNLEYLCVEIVRGSCQKLPYRVSFVNPRPTRLHASSISAQSINPDEFFTPCTNLFSVISNVISLTIFYMEHIPLPKPIIFRYLTHLKFTLSCREYWKKVGVFSELSLLQQCPVLEVVIFDMTKCSPDGRTWSLPDSIPQCLVTSLKRIEIVAPSFVENYLFVLLDYLLGSAQVLDLRKVNIDAPRPPEGYRSDKVRSYELRLVNNLFNLLWSSPRCSFEFFGIYQS